MAWPLEWVLSSDSSMFKHPLGPGTVPRDQVTSGTKQTKIWVGWDPGQKEWNRGAL
jgi:hypothetical protein